MTNHLREQTRWWVAQHSRSDEVFQTIHLDELPGCSVSGRAGVPIDLLRQVFVAGCRAMQVTSSSQRFILSVPLSESRTLLHRGEPSAERYLRRASDQEPPSLYLITGLLSAMDWEEYIRPLRLSIGELKEGSYQVYLRQFRKPEDILYGWEYANVVFFEWLGEGG